MKLHTGDTVLVITGKDRGKTGTVLRILAAQHRVIVAGVNMRVKHVKKTQQQPGRKISFEASLDASNVMLLDPKTKKPTRIGYRTEKDGKKVRISRLSGEVLEKVKKAKKDTTVKSSMSPKKPTSPKSSSDSSASSESLVSLPKKQPFWKRMGFGAEVLEETEGKDAGRPQEDHTIPSQERHIRTGPRGS